MLDPFTTLSADTVVLVVGRVFNTVAHFDLYDKTELIADCLLLMDPMSNTNGDEAVDVVVDVVVGLGADVAYAVIIFCSVVSGAIAE